MAYRKGYKFEREIFNLFQSAGYYCIRSAGSHGIFDIIAVKNGVTFGIQCKYNNHINKREELAMKTAYKQFGIIPLYAYRFKGKPLCIKCLITNKLIDVENLDELPKLYVQKVIGKIVEKNGGDKR